MRKVPKGSDDGEVCLDGVVFVVKGGRELSLAV